MIDWGISAGSHDAAIAVFQNDKIIYASHSERYSRIKNDKNLHIDQITEANQFGEPRHVYFYENSLKKKLRQACAGQWRLFFNHSYRKHLYDLGITAPITSVDHHHSHAAYAYYTNSFRHADILVLDSVGEFETITIWKGHDGKLTKTFRQCYPHSVGLWYSAMTQRLGLKPQQDEYILMGMAAYGNPSRFRDSILDDFIKKLPDRTSPSVIFKENLHRGCLWWRPELAEADYFDVAATVQSIYEEIFRGILSWMRHQSIMSSIAIVGGCALNCVANPIAHDFYRHVWIPPNPGDAGSSVGAVLAKTKQFIELKNAFLGTDIPGEYLIDEIINDLITNGLSVVASGRAEFGPRALGHRSLLADPRIIDIKDRVNIVKKREQFRPFGCMILKDHVNDYFDVPTTFDSSYMQFVAPCKKPDEFPGIIHIDGTSRIQTVDENAGSVHEMLKTWHDLTGCSLLLNTSLNVKGEPLVNTFDDASRWPIEQIDIRI